MTRQTRWSAFAGWTVEASWLLALVFAPYFFNLLSARHFEPDKATAVRALALVALAAWGIKALERITVLAERINWRAWWRSPLAIPALVYAGVFLLATATSVSPEISWWGSYNRLQGTYTNLSYMALFAVVVGNLRTRAQLDRLVTTVVLTGFSVAVYGLIQHYGYDPLPWKGDVLSRISSTMGNSIFVAAYLIMAVPFVLYRIVTSLASLRQAPRARSAADWLWIGALLVLLFGQQAFLLGLLKSGAAIRTTDFRYSWTFPTGLAIITATFALVSRRQTQNAARGLTIFAAGSLGVWVLAFLIMYGASSGVQQIDPSPLVANWGMWMGFGVVSLGLFIAASFFLPRRSEGDTPVFAIFEILGYVVALVAMLLAIFFSQSRGPQIGLLAGLAVFVNLLLWRMYSNATALASPRARFLRNLLAGAIGLELAFGAFLLAFNLSQAPVFQRLRDVPYVGRLGRLLETEDGTGRVRTLIWAGDGVGKGAIGLITANPWRTLVGYGPETMFTAYNPFYPPELARYEARGASPDRSHQAELDELVTKGALGLLSYFFLFFSALWLGWRLMMRSTSLTYQALFVAALAVVVAHLFEGLTGIPIVSTLTMLWVTFGVIVAGGILDGQLSLGEAPASVAPEPVAASVSPPHTSSSGGRGRNARAGAQRGATRTGTVARPAAQAGRGGSFRWTYGLIAALALLGIWFWNVKVVYADMWYNQASSFQPRSVDEELYRFSRILSSVRAAPDEDYYYLQLGNSLIQLAYAYKARNPQSEADLAPPRPNQSFVDLLGGGSTEETARAIWQNNSVEQLLEYARLVLERARSLSPRNKDHAANLGRLYTLWYGLHDDPAKLDAALKAYEDAHAIAPNDVVILNEWATTLASRGPAAYPEVEAKLKESERLDPRFADTYVKLGNLYRVEGKTGPAADQYVAAIARRTNALEDGRENSLDAAIAGLKGDRPALERLFGAYRDASGKRPQDAQLQSALGRIAAALGDRPVMQTAFDRAVSMAPDDVRIRQQYTAVLSQTQQYDAALQQAQTGLQLAQSQQRKDEVDRFTKLVENLQRRRAGGG